MNYEMICAGHICLDMTPRFEDDEKKSIQETLVPGRLVGVSGMVLSTGGSVANTGMAALKLGIPTMLMAKIGGDELGMLTKKLLCESGAEHLAFSVDEHHTSSFSVVLAPPGCDRIFLHDAAVNHTFGMSDIDFSAVNSTKLFHLGYPNIMNGLMEDGGRQTMEILEAVKKTGATTSLDTAYPNEQILEKKPNWQAMFESWLPYTDVFLPSIEELMRMLYPTEYEALRAADQEFLENLSIEFLPKLGERLLLMGAAIVAIKCGTLGYYVRTGTKERLQKMGRGAPANLEQWANKELFSNVFQVKEVKSATGAGDTTIAGFLSALLRGYSIEAALNIACAIGALCVQDYSATGGIVSLEGVVKKIEAGWKKRPYQKECGSFRFDKENNILTRGE